MVQYFKPVLESDLMDWIGCGWIIVRLEYKPSVSEPIYLLEWRKGGKPVLPWQVP